jgi:hypothetical protein
LFTENELAQTCLPQWSLAASVFNKEEGVFLTIAKSGLLTFFSTRTDLPVVRVTIAVSQESAENFLDFEFTIISQDINIKTGDFSLEEILLSLEQPQVTPANPNNINNPTIEIPAKL